MSYKKELSKKTRKEMRELIAKAYANELDLHLLDLSIKFDEWKSKKIACWDLNDCIHKFHDGISRELFNLYNARNDVLMIARAVTKSLIQKEEIPGEIIPDVELCIGFILR